MLDHATVSNLIHTGQELLRLPSLLPHSNDRFFERMPETGPLELRFFLGKNARLTKAQKQAMLAYAERLAQLNEAQRPVDVLDAPVSGLSFHEWFVCTEYAQRMPRAQMTDEQLRALVRFIVHVAQSMLAFVSNPEAACGLPKATYKRRGFPRPNCSVSPWNPFASFWSITGDDEQTQESGVLEFCVSEFDASETLSLMSRFPERFKNLKAVCASV